MLLLFWWGAPLPDSLPQVLSQASALIRIRVLVAPHWSHLSELDRDKLRQLLIQMISSSSGTSSPLVPPLRITRLQHREPPPHKSPGIFGWKGLGQPHPCRGVWTRAHIQGRFRCCSKGSRHSEGASVSAGKFCPGLSQTLQPITSSYSWSILARK